MPPRRSTQAGPSQTRRRRDEDEAEDDDAGSNQDIRGDADNDSSVSKQAAQLVRLALFSEYKRRILNRAEITKEIGKGTKIKLDEVFREANDMLQKTFGMELVELRAKRAAGTAAETQIAVVQTQQGNGKGKSKGRPSRGDDQNEENSSEEEDTAAGASTQKRQKVARSNAYVLRSTLPATLIAKMNQPRTLPATRDRDDEGQRIIDEAPDSGALLRWEKADATASGHIALLGIRTIILSLVLCMGRVIQNDHLHSLLSRLNLVRDTILSYASPDAIKGPPLTLDKYLDLLARQGYLEKTKLSNPNHDAEEDFEWRWGNRDVEFTEKSAAEFIERIFFKAEDDEIEAAQGGPRAAERNGRANGNGNGNGEAHRNGQGRNGEADKAERVKEKERFRVNLVKSAGGPLAGDV